MAETLQDFIEELKKAFGSNLATVMVYGVGATAADVSAHKGLNTLIVLDRITPADLRLIEPLVDKWRKAGHHLPIFFTQEEINDAADVFPIEFGDMASVHQVQYGPDPFEGYRTNLTDLRHQLEYELRKRLLKLRGLYIPNSSDGEKLTRLMSDSLNSFALYFRHVLILLGLEPPLKKRELIELIVKQLGLQNSPFEVILSTGTEKKLSEAEANQVFSEYIEELQKVIEAVDKLEGVS